MHPRITAIQTDLENGTPMPFAGHGFDGIVVTNYLWRPTFPLLLGALKPGGIFLYETFAQGNATYGRPSNPDFLLDRGELLTLTQGLTVIAFEDGIFNGAKVAQRICAANATGPLPVL
jgi:hypothetical protein